MSEEKKPQRRVDTVWITLRTSFDKFEPGGEDQSMDVHEFVFDRTQICRLFNDEKTTLRAFFRGFLPEGVSGDEEIMRVRLDAQVRSLIPRRVKAMKYDGNGGEEKIR